MSSYSGTILQDGPSMYLRFGSGGLTDQSGNARNGTAVGSPTVGGAAGALIGDADAATDFNGTTQAVTTAYNPFTNGTTRTYEGWTNLDAMAGYFIWGSTGQKIGLQMGGGGGGVNFYSNSNVDSVTWLASWPGATQWVHHVLRFEEAADTVTLYLNGVSQGQKAHATAYNTGSTGPFVTAYDGAINWLDGKQDEIAIYEYGLTAARIKHHFDVGKGRIGVPKRRVLRPVSAPVAGAVYR